MSRREKIYTENELLKLFDSKKHQKRKNYFNQSGGSSDYVNSFHAWIGNNASLTATSLKGINNTPLFNPFNPQARFATETTGIIPVGQYYMSGGNKNKIVNISTGKINPWIEHVKKESFRYGISYKEGLSNEKIKQSYYKTKFN